MKENRYFIKFVLQISFDLLKEICKSKYTRAEADAFWYCLTEMWRDCRIEQIDATREGRSFNDENASRYVQIDVFEAAVKERE